jgi:hypothetical protein
VGEPEPATLAKQLLALHDIKDRPRGVYRSFLCAQTLQQAEDGQLPLAAGTPHRRASA